jgi:gamma-glutamyltranspeptidase/glutathione hydrolase
MRLRCVLTVALCLGPSAYPQGRLPERTHARSMVISPQGIVATSQVLASQAGAMILAKGGSAVDAAIAANAVLSSPNP